MDQKARQLPLVPQFKAGTQSAGDPYEFVLSDESVDRAGDIIKADGWSLKDFRKNPIALFGHSHDKILGTWDKVRVEGKRLIGRLKMAEPGTSDLVDTTRALLEQGVLKAVSVGFMPLEGHPIDKDKPWDGWVYTKSALHEVSLVAVPANPNAIAVAKMFSPDLADILLVRADPAGGKPDPTPGRVTNLLNTPRLEAATARLQRAGLLKD